MKKQKPLTINRVMNCVFVDIIGHGIMRLDAITMSNSSFSTPLQKYGNSWILRVPPQVAKLYKLGDEVKVTIEKTE